MDPIRNPYAPGAGTPPPELAGRDERASEGSGAAGFAWSGRVRQGLEGEVPGHRGRGFA